MVPTEEQGAALTEFKAHYTSRPQRYLKDDAFWLKWLIARDFDVEKAIDMLDYHLRYREALGMDNPDYKNYQKDHMDPTFSKYYTQGRMGRDKDGRPIVYYNYGYADYRGLLKSVPARQILYSVMYFAEDRRKICEEVSTSEKRIEYVNYILDLEGLGSRQIWKPIMDLFVEICNIVEKHTPEIVHKIFVINAPSVFSFLYKIIQPILDHRTKERIEIFGKSGYQESLLSLIDADQLPKFYGGTVVDSNGDPMCSEFICYGGKVPEELYFDDSNTDELITQNIKAGKSYRVTIPATLGQKLKWYFKTQGSDIGFGVYLAESEQDSLLVSVDELPMKVAYFRLVSVLPEFGDLIADQSGYYVFFFNNDYSRFSSKTIDYSIMVE